MHVSLFHQVVFEFVLHGVFLNIIGIVGLVGNGLCIAVLTRPQMRGSPTNLILCALVNAAREDFFETILKDAYCLEEI